MSQAIIEQTTKRANPTLALITPLTFSDVPAGASAVVTAGIDAIACSRAALFPVSVAVQEMKPTCPS
jgi:hypothetical protein